MVQRLNIVDYLSGVPASHPRHELNVLRREVSLSLVGATVSMPVCGRDLIENDKHEFMPMFRHDRFQRGVVQRHKNSTFAAGINLWSTESNHAPSGDIGANSVRGAEIVRKF